MSRCTLPDGYGVQCEDVYGQRDFAFNKCKFIGSEFSSNNGTWGGLKGGTAAYVKGAHAIFTCCDFYGEIIGMRDEISNQNDATQFNQCNFNEEYYDSDSGKTYSFTMDCSFDCSNASADSKLRTYLVYANGWVSGTTYRRVSFNNCSFNTNYGSAIGSFYGTYSNTNPLEAIQIRNCKFYNGGLNGKIPTANCDFNNQISWCTDPTHVWLLSFYGVNFIGNNILEYCRGNGITNGCDFSDGFVNNNTSTSLYFDDYCWSSQNYWVNGTNYSSLPLGYVKIHDYYYDGNCGPPQTIGGYPPLDFGNVSMNASFDNCPTERFVNPPTLELFSSSSNDQYESIFSQCDPNQTRFSGTIKDSENIRKLTVFPSPATLEINIIGLIPPDELTIYDLFGSALLTQSISSPSIKLDISKIVPGIYFAMFKRSGSIRFFKGN